MADRKAYASRSNPQQGPSQPTNYGPQGYPPGYLPPNYGPQGYPPPNYGPQVQGYPPGYPPLNYGPNYPPQGYPPPNYGPQGYPPGYPPPSPYNAPPTPYPQLNIYDGHEEFSDKSVRMKFIRKVYAILSVQIAATVGIMALFIFNDDVKIYVMKNAWLIFVAIGISLVTFYAIACFEDFRRNYPWNVVCLAVFTLVEAFIMGVFCIFFKASEVFTAGAITCVVFFALTLFAFQTSIDFTVLNGLLFICCIVLFAMGIFLLFFPSRILYIIKAALGTILFSLYIIVDTQMMLGGKHKYQISPEDYVFAALNLYIDVIVLFSYILRLLGIFGDDDD